MQSLQCDSDLEPNLYEIFYMLTQELAVGYEVIAPSSYWHREIINNEVICTGADEKYSVVHVIFSSLLTKLTLQPLLAFFEIFQLLCYWNHILQLIMRQIKHQIINY